MTIFNARIFYLRQQTILKLLYLNLNKHFTPKRALITCIMVVMHVFMVFLLSIGRTIDEYIYSDYRKLKLKAPLFIISNPRSGTTLLHKLLHSDKSKYNSTLLYHTIFPCICYIKLIKLIFKIDRKMGAPIKSLVQKFEIKIFGAWKNIHPLGFNRTEEDEALFVFAGLSPALFLLAPWISEFPSLHFLDQLTEKEKSQFKSFYISSLKRIQFATEPDKTLLIKNVFSTARLEFILDCFPDARIIYPIRHPEKAVVSLVSMFSKIWEMHCPDLERDKSAHRQLAQLAMEYYRYIFQKHKTLSSSRLYVLPYEQLTNNLHESIAHIYQHYGFEMTNEFEKLLKAENKKSKNYRSRHNYNARDFGIDPDQIQAEMSEITSHFWPKEKEKPAYSNV